MNIIIYLYVSDTDGGTNATAYTEDAQALEALHAHAVSVGYEGVADYDAIAEWQDAEYTGIDTFYVCEQEINISALSRAYTALQDCITALDMDDAFGDDIDARHSAEEDAFCAAKAALPDPYPTQKCYIVMGRFYNDDNVWKRFYCDSEEEAVGLWKDWMIKEDPGNSNELHVIEVFKSDTLIEPGETHDATIREEQLNNE